MKKYFLSYDFMGERITREFTDLMEFMQWLDKVSEDRYIVSQSIDFKTETVEP